MQYTLNKTLNDEHLRIRCKEVWGRKRAHLLTKSEKMRKARIELLLKGERVTNETLKIEI
jgi:hypothetical protein